MKKALIAMSGGIDSSVTAYLMKNKGFDCIGVTFKMFDKSNPLFGFSGNETETDIEDARKVCEKIGIPFYAIDASAEFKKYVIDNFITTYENGGTPNPCVQCNRYVKFKLLLDTAEKFGCDVTATGHYAKKGFDEKNGRYYIAKADDLTKDQSYVLYSLTQEQLKKVCFPLADITKNEARKIAEENGFVNAHKSDSQDICFIHDGDYGRFITAYTKKTYPEGSFVDTNGKVLGKHKGIVNYTIGQRRGLEIPYGTRIYVKEKNIHNNTVVLASDELLYEKEISVGQFNPVASEDFFSPINCFAKIRYSKRPEQPCTAVFADNGTLKITFKEPQRAPAKGQSAVLYDENGIVLGGGIIL